MLSCLVTLVYLAFVVVPVLVILIYLLHQELAFGEEEKIRNKKVGLLSLYVSWVIIFPAYLVFVFLLLTFASFVMKDSRIHC